MHTFNHFTFLLGLISCQICLSKLCLEGGSLPVMSVMDILFVNYKQIQKSNQKHYLIGTGKD